MKSLKFGIFVLCLVICFYTFEISAACRGPPTDIPENPICRTSKPTIHINFPPSEYDIISYLFYIEMEGPLLIQEEIKPNVTIPQERVEKIQLFVLSTTKIMENCLILQQMTHIQP